MEELIILSTGVHAAEMAEIVERVNAVERRWDLLGYLAGEGAAASDLPGQINGYAVLGPFESLARYPGARLVPSYGFLGSHEVDVDRLVSLIDPSCFVSRTAVVGPGCVLYPHCFVGLGSRLGAGVFCLSGATINHDDVLEDEVTLASGARLAGFVHVERGCYLGQGCTVREHVRIGRGSKIGTGAVVVKDVEPNSVMAGNPAVRLRANR